MDCCDFSCGFLTGAAAALVFILLAAILLTLLKLPRKAGGVLLSAPLGTVFISSAAIADLVKSVGMGFSEIDILKVILYQGRKGLRLYVAVSFPYDPDGCSISEVAAEFPQRVVDALQRNLGIENIRNIELDVRRGKPKAAFY